MAMDSFLMPSCARTGSSEHGRDGGPKARNQMRIIRDYGFRSSAGDVARIRGEARRDP